MVAETQRAMHHVGHDDIGHVVVPAEHQVGGLVFRVARSHPAVGRGRRHFFFLANGLGRALDGVDDLLVARATAQVMGQRLLDLIAARLNVVVDQAMGLHDHARDTEAALHPAL